MGDETNRDRALAVLRALGCTSPSGGVEDYDLDYIAEALDAAESRGRAESAAEIAKLRAAAGRLMRCAETVRFGAHVTRGPHRDGVLLEAATEEMARVLGADGRAFPEGCE